MCDGFPVFYSQIRVGKHGVEFKMFKFRTMVKNADQIGSHQTAESDQRITKVGSFLRKTSIDELPQLINVLKGDMSLVGPRPNVLNQKIEYTEKDWTKRNKVAPGITGLAQVSGRSSLSFKERLHYDTMYVDKVGLLMDAKILSRTVLQVLLRKGSN